MDAQTVRLHPNLNLQWISPDGWLASRGYEIWYSRGEGQAWARLCRIKTGLTAWCSNNPAVSQVGRLGIHNLIRLASGAILCAADGVLYRSAGIGAEFTPQFSGFSGRRPLRMGICQDGLGRVYLGEYFMNRERKEVRLWRSDDDGLNWFPVHIWAAGEIRHVHFVQADPFEQKIWLGTGDDDRECWISCSSDGGASFQTAGGGSQLWRAGSLMFSREAVYWATDIGFDHNKQPNFIVRFDRKTGSLWKVWQTPGPAYYSACLADGTHVTGTCVEQPNPQNDVFLHLLWTKDWEHWNDLRLWPKIWLPPIAGPATITFPLSAAPASQLYFNVYLTRRNHGALFKLVL